MNITKRLTRDKSYIRPKKTFQETMTNKEIEDKLKDYKKVSNIIQVPINTHIRYFTKDKTGNKVFRLGGVLTKVGDNQKYIVLSNGTLSWSVQLDNSQLFQKMSDAELKQEIRKEITQQIDSGADDVMQENDELRKENKDLMKKLEHVTKKLDFIEDAIKKDKQKKKK
jgi:hypothetical protein